ncbi:hypothetical protein V6N13_148061 [Hibiscus sabdariffa]
MTNEMTGDVKVERKKNINKYESSKNQNYLNSFSESACSNLRSYLAPRPIILTRNGSRARCPRRSPATDPPSVDVVMADFVQATTKRATRKKGEGHGLNE